MANGRTRINKSPCIDSSSEVETILIAVFNNSPYDPYPRIIILLNSETSHDSCKLVNSCWPTLSGPNMVVLIRSGLSAARRWKILTHSMPLCRCYVLVYPDASHFILSHVTTNYLADEPLRRIMSGANADPSFALRLVIIYLLNCDHCTQHYSTYPIIYVYDIVHNFSIILYPHILIFAQRALPACTYKIE